MNGDDSMPEIDALTDEERIEFLSYIPRRMQRPLSKLLTVAGKYDLDLVLDHIRNDLKTSTSVDGRQVDKLVEAYASSGPEEATGTDAMMRGGTVEVEEGDTQADDAAQEPAEGEDSSGGLGVGVGLGG